MSSPPPLPLLSSSSESQSQWSDLPDDLLTLILSHMVTRTDLCRFRSICKSWRSFTNPTYTHHIFPLLLPPRGPNYRRLYIYPSSLYILSKNRSIWLVSMAEKGNLFNLYLSHPLTNLPFYSLYEARPESINMLGFESYLVGRSYEIELEPDWSGDGFWYGFYHSPWMEVFRKVVVKTFESVAVLGLCAEGRIWGWKKGEDKWVSFYMGENTKSFDDVICFNGDFYAVDWFGRLVTVNSSSFEVVELVSPVEIENYIKNTYLVESNFRLYLVIKVVSKPEIIYDEEKEKWVVDKTKKTKDEKPLAFKVYVFSQREKKWQKVDSLGNMVFFLGRDTTFSVKGIYFERWTEDVDRPISISWNIGVYSLESHDVSIFNTLTDDKARIFFPPSIWYEDSYDIAMRKGLDETDDDEDSVDETDDDEDSDDIATRKGLDETDDDDDSDDVATRKGLDETIDDEDSGDETDDEEDSDDIATRKGLDEFR